MSGMCLTASTVTVLSSILQIEPSPNLLQGSKVELHPLTHAQFATFHSVQRLSPKKGASDKNSQAGEHRRDTKFSREVLLSFPSQSSKFRVLLHFADVIARRHSQAIA